MCRLLGPELSLSHDLCSSCMHWTLARPVEWLGNPLGPYPAASLSVPFSVQIPRDALAREQERTFVTTSKAQRWITRASEQAPGEGKHFATITSGPQLKRQQLGAGGSDTGEVSAVALDSRPL